MHAVLPNLARSWRTPLGALCLAFLALTSACSDTDQGLPPVVFAEPETAVGYEVALEGSPSDEVTALAEQSLEVYRLQDKGAASIAFLRRRAEGDVPTLLKILRSRGFYSGSAAVKVQRLAEAGEAETALVTVTIDPGRPYTLVLHSLVIDQAGTVVPPQLDAAEFGSPVGGRALAAAIAAAEKAAARRLRQTGFPYAAFKGRSGLADPEAASLEVESTIAAGPAYTFGPTSFVGLERVDEAYLRSYMPWKTGERFDEAALREFQRRLFATDLFSALTVRIPESPPVAGKEPAPLPVAVELEEGPRNRIAGSLRYSTDLGPSLRASYEHRNLFGANERLLVQIEPGLEEQSVGLGLRKPQFLRPGQELLTDVTFLRTVDDAYDAETVAAFVGLERQLSRRWRAGLGGLGEWSRIDDNGDESKAYLLGAPFFVTYDGSNDLFDPTEGGRLRIEVTPFGGTFDGSDTEFLVFDTRGSAYLPLDAERQYVVAGRGRVATILSPSFDVIPATRLLYSGGGNSVRGYAEDFIGPLDDDGDPVGGRSALEAGIELHARLFGDFGGVAFAEAGTVATEPFPDFEEGVQVGAGLGVRYYSPAGPIRLDVALPVNPRGADDPFQAYFSIGQAF